MRIELCIPAFNEERVIAEAVRAALGVFRKVGKEVVLTVVDNASTDRTASIAKGIEGVRVMSIPVRGKGAAVVAAARRSDADIFGFLDADLSVDPSEVIALLPLLECKECDIVIGSRLMDSGIVDRGKFRTFSSRVFNRIRKMLVGVAAKDTQCGLKLMNVRGREVLAACGETGWFFDIEFLARAERAGLSIREVPVHWQEHRFPERTSKLHHVRDSMEALRTMLRIRRRLMRGEDSSRHSGAEADIPPR
jgi:glycosyltransferase involved in cell wall biosynthesis